MANLLAAAYLFLESSSEEESEDEAPQPPPTPSKPKRKMRKLLRMRKSHGAFNISSMSDNDTFHTKHRMTRQTFSLLHHHLCKNYEESTSNNSISLKHKLSCVLNYLATGHSMTSTASDYLTSIAHISNAISEICQLIIDTLQPLVFKPLTVKEFLNNAVEFQALRGFPHAVGAIDGKHIRMKNQSNMGSVYYNYKNFFSIILLAICDARQRFIYVDIGAPGSLPDGHVWKNSLLFRALEDGTMKLPEPSALPGTTVEAPYVFLGDEAFGLTTQMLVPFPGRSSGTLTPQQLNFNQHLSSSRLLIEHTFGILTAKWRIFHRPIEAKYETVKLITHACVCLHNFVMEHEGPTKIDKQTIPTIPVNMPPNVVPVATNEAKKSRQIFSDFFKNNKFRPKA